MKTCPKCGAEYEDFMSFCMKDGTPLGVDDSSASAESDPIPAPPTDEIQSVQPTDMETEQFSAEDVAAGETQADDYEQETVIRNRMAIPTTPVGDEATGQDQNASAGQQEVKSGSQKKSNIGVIVAVLLLGGLLFIGAIAGGGLWWYLSSGSGDEIVSANTNADDNSGEANENSDNSSELSNDNTDENSNEDKTPTPSPTKTPSPSPTKTPSPSPTETPTPSPSATPTATPNDNPTPTQNPTPRTTPTPPQTPRTIAGGVVNGKARSLPKPAYPASARAVGAKGAVNVRVLIDESGNVVSARAVSGHPLLRGPAARAARNAKFNPTQLSGQPVKVSGIITYVFN